MGFLSLEAFRKGGKADVRKRQLHAFVCKDLL